MCLYVTTNEGWYHPSLLFFSTSGEKVGVLKSRNYYMKNVYMKNFIITIAALVSVVVLMPREAQATTCTVNSFSAAQSTITSGGSTTVSWTTSGCDTVSITPAQNPDNRPPSGSVSTGPLSQTTTFTVVGRTSYGYSSQPRSVTITVSNGGGSSTGGVCVPTDFTTTLTHVAYGQGTTLHWDSQNCDSAAIHPAAYPGDRPPYGSIFTGAIYATTEFSLTVYDAAGHIGGQRFLTVYVDGNGSNDSQCTINSFDADDTSIDHGDSTDLTWNTTGCDYVTLTDVSGELSPDGNHSVHPSSTKTYTLKAYDYSGNLGDTDTVTIHVNGNSSCSVGDFYASPSTIDRGNSATLRWETNGDVDYVTISGLSGNRPENGSISVSPYSTQTYTLRVYCNNGDSKTDSATVYVRNTNVDSAPQAITTVAAILGNTQARLNGIAVPNTTYTTSAWFEWGVSASLGNRTPSQYVASGNSQQYYSAVVSGLVPGGVYYYRAVVQNTNGTAYGDIVRFQTTKTTTPTVIVHPTTTTSTVVVAQSAPSLLELRVESAYDHMCINGLMDYTVTYRNISNQTLTNTVLQFTHPKEISYLSGSRGNYEVVDRTLTIALGDVRPGEEGTITIHTRVNDTAIRGNLSVATATVVYTNSKTHAQENAIAYSLITVSNDCPSVLGASAFGFGSFLPSTLLGWLLLILVILALIVLARHVSKKNAA